MIFINEYKKGWVKEMKIELQFDKKTKNFSEIVIKELKLLQPDVEIVTAGEGDNVWHLFGEKSKISDDVKLIFDNLGMCCGVKGQDYFLKIDGEVYNRLQYEEFIKLAKRYGIKLGASRYWLLVQLTFPFNFWSLTKQQSIIAKIRRQQYRLLTAICLQN